MSGPIKTSTESFYVKNCLGYVRSSDIFLSCKNKTGVFKKKTLNKHFEISNCKDFVLKEVSVNIGPCFDINEKIFQKGQVNINDVRKFLKSVHNSKNQKNCFIKNCSRYIKPHFCIENTNNNKKPKIKSIPLNTFNKKCNVNAFQTKLKQLQGSPQLQVELIDCIQYIKMESSLTANEKEGTSKLCDKSELNDNIVQNIEQEINKKLNDIIDAVVLKSEEGDNKLKENRKNSENDSLNELINCENVNKTDKKDFNVVQKIEDPKVQSSKEILDNKKTKESLGTKVSAEVQKIHNNSKKVQDNLGKKKFSNVKKISEQNLTLKKSKMNLKSDLSHKYSSSKSVCIYKSPLKKSLSVSEKIKRSSDKKYRSCSTESTQYKGKKDIDKMFMSTGHSSFESDVTSQSENENEINSSKMTVNKIHNTRKTHPSYAKIRVKSQEALGVKNLNNKSKSADLKKQTNVNINLISNIDKIIEKDPLALDSPKEEAISTSEKRSRGRPSLNGKRKNLCDKSSPASQPIVKRMYKMSNKEIKQCRLCGELAADYLDVFSPSANDMNLLEKIKEYLIITILKDELSKHACIACTTMVINWANFYQRCKEINKQFLNKQKNSSLSSENINDGEKSNFKVDSIIDSIKKESDSEDNIEKMLREMHGMDSDDNGIENDQKITTNEVIKESNLQRELFYDSDMNVEFLEEERDLVDEALLYQKINVYKPSNALKVDSKIIRMDKKLSEKEVRELMDKHKVSSNSVVVLKVDSKQHFSNEDIKNTLKDLKKRQNIKKNHKDTLSDCKNDEEYYVQIAKSYAHRHLESIQTATETYYKCLDCRDYIAASLVPRHCLEKHSKMDALCDFCSLLLPYDSEEHKMLVKEHINLHNLKKSKTHPDVIINISKLLQNVLITKTEYITNNFEELKNENSTLKEIDNTEIKKNSNIVINDENLLEKKKQNRYRCKICQQKFSTVSLLRDHNMIQHTSIKLECEYCFEMFSTKQNLMNHIKIKHPDTSENSRWICEECGQVYEKREEYIQHKITEHNISKPEVFVCLQCDKRFKSIENLRDHVRTHKSLLCEICGETFRTRLSVRSHKRCVHNVNMHPCPHCDYVAVSNSRLKIHVRLHNAFAAFSCEQCDESFYTTKRLRDHIQRQHIDQKDVRKYNCPLCDWTFHVEVNLKKHFEVHVEKGHITCKVCQEKFEQAGDILEMTDVIKHKERHTEQENMIFKRPYSPSVSRMKSWSNGGNQGARAVCRDCGLTFATPNELRKHHKIHKPFYCEICKTLSNNEQTYNQHMDQHSERKHGCKTCGKMFMTRPALGLHMRTHVKEPKHQCKVCQRKFLLTADWRRHERVCRMKYGFPDSSDLRAIKYNCKKENLSEEYTIIDNIKTVITEDGRQILYECTSDEVLEDTNKEEIFEHLTSTEQRELQPNDFVQLIIENDESNTTDADETIEIDESELLAFREWQKVIARKEQEEKNKLVTQHLTDHYILPERAYIYQTENNDDDEITNERNCSVNIESNKFSHALISSRYNIENKQKIINSLDICTTPNRSNLNSESEGNVIFSESPYVLENNDRTQIIISENSHLSNDNYVFSSEISTQEMILSEDTETIILKQNNDNVHIFNETAHFKKIKNIEMDAEENLNLRLKNNESVQDECFNHPSIVFDDNTNNVSENTLFERDEKEFRENANPLSSNQKQNITSVYIMKNREDSNSHSGVTTIYLQESPIDNAEITEITDQICEIPNNTSLTR